ncbi:hypothetical protein [Deinococcus sp.]|uniref:hypothetical protein n=1 Tax=Deinococcus sp. TaxID=47478 RepID=UPI003CC67B2B
MKDAASKERLLIGGIVLGTVLLVPLLWLCQHLGLIPAPVSSFLADQAPRIMGVAVLSTIGPAVAVLRRWRNHSRT